jgi:hypothetical protein
MTPADDVINYPDFISKLSGGVIDKVDSPTKY